MSLFHSPCVCACVRPRKINDRCIGETISELFRHTTSSNISVAGDHTSKSINETTEDDVVASSSGSPYDLSSSEDSGEMDLFICLLWTMFYFFYCAKFLLFCFIFYIGRSKGLIRPANSPPTLLLPKFELKLLKKYTRNRFEGLVVPSRLLHKEP